ncbi:MAG TPA: multicopper oxidase domain-containing protein, partial [Methylocella sp.]|nr:multicopper oxidase domain-containing protein [Methylocella sp.]
MSSFLSFSRRMFLGQTIISLLPLSTRSEEPATQDGFRIIEASPASLQLLPEPAKPTPVLAFDGRVPGPLLRYKKGAEIRIRLLNKLDQPTSLNWHGMRIVNAMDGVAGLTQDPVPPGGSFDYRFVPPDSGFFWYHPQVPAFARTQQARGLYGALIIDEESKPEVDLDLLLVLSDWTLDEKNAIADFPSDTTQPGSQLTVNSHPVPATEVLAPGARLRIRLLNAADSRIMLVVFEGITPVILAIDGQPCEPFEPQRQTIPIGPGARFDILCDLPSDAGAPADLSLLDERGKGPVLLQFKTQGERRATLPPMGPLEPNSLLPQAIKLEAAHRADLLI